MLEMLEGVNCMQKLIVRKGNRWGLVVVIHLSEERGRYSHTASLVK
jgi:hypothetical protein